MQKPGLGALEAHSSNLRPSAASADKLVLFSISPRLCDSAVKFTQLDSSITVHECATKPAYRQAIRPASPIDDQASNSALELNGGLCENGGDALGAFVRR
jgi:hypothetical protein